MLQQDGAEVGVRGTSGLMSRLTTEERRAACRAMGERVVLLRKRAGLSQADLAAALGVSLATVGAWERGVNEMRVLDAREVAAVLGTTLEALTGPPLS